MNLSAINNDDDYDNDDSDVVDVEIVEDEIFDVLGRGSVTPRAAAHYLVPGESKVWSFSLFFEIKKMAFPFRD